MSNKKPIFWLITLNLLLFCGFGGHNLYKRHQASAANQQAITYVAKEYERLGVMPQDDYRAVMQIRDSIQRTHSISDADLEWWIQFANRSAVSKSEQKMAASRRLVALKANLRFLTNATSQQRDKLFELAQSYMPNQENSKGSDGFFGIALIAALDEKRAAPLLTSLLSQPQQDPFVSRISKKLLKKWSSSAVSRVN